MVPFRLLTRAPVTAPCPSKVSVPTLAIGPAMDGGAVMTPVPFCAKVPFRVALVHPLSSAFAVGARPRASTVTAAIVKVFAMVLRFMMLSFAFISCLHSGRRSFRDLFFFHRYRRQGTPKSGHVSCIFFVDHGEDELAHRRAHRGNHIFVEGLGQRRRSCPGPADGARLSGTAPHGPPAHEERSPGQFLQATVLVHEVYLRLVDVANVEWQGRAQFFAIAAQMMRRILVDAARTR